MPSALLVFILALAVFSAGCFTQDRPHEEALYVVADAGPDQILEVGATASLAWHKALAIEAEGNATPQVEVTYQWSTTGAPCTPRSGDSVTYSCTSGGPTFDLVALNVTAEKTTASDAAGLLFVPGASDISQKIYLVARGDLSFTGGTVTFQDVVSRPTIGSHHAFAFAGGLHLPTDRYANFGIQLGSPAAGQPQGSILLGVKNGTGPARTFATQMLEFNASRNYTLLIDTNATAQHRMVASVGGLETENLTLENFRAAHAVSELAVRVRIVPAQTLPGFEGAAAAAGLAAIAIIALRNRRT